MSWNRKY